MALVEQSPIDIKYNPIQWSISRTVSKQGNQATVLQSERVPQTHRGQNFNDILAMDIYLIFGDDNCPPDTFYS